MVEGHLSVGIMRVKGIVRPCKKGRFRSGQRVDHYLKKSGERPREGGPWGPRLPSEVYGGSTGAAKPVPAVRHLVPKCYRGWKEDAIIPSPTEKVAYR